MRVPPDQSSTALHHLRHRDIGVAALQQARGARQPRAERRSSRRAPRHGRAHARSAAACASSGSSSPRCRPAPPSAPAAGAAGASASRRARRRGAPSSAAWRASRRGRRAATPRRAASAAARTPSAAAPARAARRATRRRSWCRSRPCAAPRGRSRVNAASNCIALVGLGLRRIGPGFGNSASPSRRFSRCSGGSACLRPHLGQQHRAHAALEIGVAPEQTRTPGRTESLCSMRSSRQVLSTAWKSRSLSKPADASACSASCTRSVPTAHARNAQHAREVHDVFGQVAGGMARGDEHRQPAVERAQSRGRVCAGARIRQPFAARRVPAVLGLMARRETRFAPCGRSLGQSRRVRTRSALRARP